MFFPTESLRLTFAQPGNRVWNEGDTPGAKFIHRKAVPYIIIAQPTEGEYFIQCGDGTSGLIKPGEAFITPPNIPLSIEHRFNPETRRMAARWIHLNFTVFNAINLASLFKLPLRIERGWAGKFGAISDEMARLGNNADAYFLKTVAGIHNLAFSALHILIEYLEVKGVFPQVSPEMERLLPALEYARANLDRKLDVTTLARKANLSVPRFHAVFKSMFGDAPLCHVRKMRLSKASDLLRTSAASIEEIALQTGFCNQFHLSREFRRCFGRPPSVFRKNISEGLLV